MRVGVGSDVILCVIRTMHVYLYACICGVCVCVCVCGERERERERERVASVCEREYMYVCL